MKNNRGITIIFCGLAAMCATVVFYLLAFDSIFNITMRWLSLTVLLLVELVGTVKALAAKSIFGVGQIVTGAVHLAVALGLSILFVNLFPCSFKNYILLNVLTLIAVAAIDALLIYYNRRAQAENRNYAATAAVIDACETKARQLLLDNKKAAFAPGLEEVVELFTYANRAAAGVDDGQLLMRVNELERLISGNETDQISEAIKQLQNMLKLRKEATKKTGSF